jgi:hypothetical protein
MAIGMAAGAGRVAVAAYMRGSRPAGRGGPARAGAHVWEPRRERAHAPFAFLQRSSLCVPEQRRCKPDRAARGYRCRATHWRARVVVTARQGRARPAFTCVSTLQIQVQVQEAVRPPGGAAGNRSCAAAVQGQLSSRSVAQDWPRVLLLSLY